MLDAESTSRTTELYFSSNQEALPRPSPSELEYASSSDPIEAPLNELLAAARARSGPEAGLTTADGRAVFRPPRTGIALMHAYRTHTCGALRLSDAGGPARLSGWVHRKRDHGQLLFIDLRDHYGVTQCVIDISSPLFPMADALRLESVVTMTGRIAARSADTVNPKLDTGEVELVIADIEVQSEAEPLPFPVNT